MKCTNMNVESLDFMKSKEMAFNYEDCTKKFNQDREESTPIKCIPQTKGDANIYMNSELDTKAITTRLDELIRNQMTTNDTLLTLSNRILELEKNLKEKNGIIQNLEIKINILEQNERACLVEISGVKKEPNENVETIVSDIAGIIDVGINLFDIENVYRKLSNRNLEAPQIDQEYEQLTTGNCFRRLDQKQKNLDTDIWTRNGRIL
ncbi:hypothetical protein QTP88_029568 [Uroleucon formosanum]